MSNLMTKAQKEEYIAVLNHAITVLSKGLKYIRIGIALNAGISLWCLAFGIICMLNKQPQRIIITMDFILCIGNAFLAWAGLNDLEASKKFIADRKEELEFISSQETED